jgi:hypothetical protein
VKCPNIKFHKICPVGTEVFLVDGHTHIKKLIVAFGNYFSKEPSLLIRRLYTLSLDAPWNYEF